MLFPALPGAQIWGSEARDRRYEQFGGFALGVRPSMDGGRGKRGGVVLLLGRRLRGRDLAVEAAAEVRRAAVPEGVELLQLVPQEVPQGGPTHRAAKARKQEVAAGAGRRREVERVVRGIPHCFHDGGEPGFL